MGATSKILQELSSSQPPDVLYHYTSQAGLLGILEKDSIWATKIQYLNDSSEFQLALDLARSVLNDRLQTESDSRQKNKITCLISNLWTIEWLNVCVCSFSRNDDQLSQWRGYAGSSGGYSCGLRSRQLKLMGQTQGFSLLKCIYDDDEQRRLICRLVDESMEEDFNTEEGYIDPANPRTFVSLPTGGDFTKNLARLAPIIKNSAFREESEWRVVSAGGISSLNLSFRPGHSMLLPFVNFELGKKSDYLDRLVVGPTPHGELAKGATESLLAKYGVAQRVKVTPSGIPYRSW